MNSFSGLIHRVQAEKQNSNWFQNEPFFQTTNKKTKDLLRKTNQKSLKKKLCVHVTDEGTNNENNSIVGNTFLAAAKHVLQERQPRVDL